MGLEEFALNRGLIGFEDLDRNAGNSCKFSAKLGNILRCELPYDRGRDGPVCGVLETGRAASTVFLSAFAERKSVG